MMAKTREFLASDDDAGDRSVREGTGEDYALVIGVNDYPTLRSLRGAIADAEAFAAWLVDADGGRVQATNVHTIVSMPDPLTPIGHEINDALEDVLERANKTGGRRFYFYFSGHGCVGDRASDISLCMANWSELRRRAALSSDAWLDVVVRSGAFAEVAFFLDCCRVWAVRAVGLPPHIDFARPVEREEPTRVFVAYATEFQRVAVESAADESDGIRGNFTRTLLRGLSGYAASGKNGVTADSLKYYLEDCIQGRRQRAEVQNAFRRDARFGFAGMSTPKLLFLGANSHDTTRLQLSAEVRDIRRGLAATGAAEAFDLVTELAVRPSDLQRLLLSHAPHVLHLSGHGSERSELAARSDRAGGDSREFVPAEPDEPEGTGGGLLLEDVRDSAVHLRPDVLLAMLSIPKRDTPLRCVVLDRCFTTAQAEAIAEYVDCVVRTAPEIDDDAALAFTTGFYRAIAHGKNVRDAFSLGCLELALRGLPGDDVPQLFCRRGVAAENVFVAKKAAPRHARNDGGVYYSIDTWDRAMMTPQLADAIALWQQSLATVATGFNQLPEVTWNHPEMKRAPWRIVIVLFDGGLSGIGWSIHGSDVDISLNGTNTWIDVPSKLSVFSSRLTPGGYTLRWNGTRDFAIRLHSGFDLEIVLISELGCPIMRWVPWVESILPAPFVDIIDYLDFKLAMKGRLCQLAKMHAGELSDEPDFGLLAGYQLCQADPPNPAQIEAIADRIEARIGSTPDTHALRLRAAMLRGSNLPDLVCREPPVFREGLLAFIDASHILPEIVEPGSLLEYACVHRFVDTNVSSWPSPKESKTAAADWLAIAVAELALEHSVKGKVVDARTIAKELRVPTLAVQAKMCETSEEYAAILNRNEDSKRRDLHNSTAMADDMAEKAEMRSRLLKRDYQGALAIVQALLAAIPDNAELRSICRTCLEKTTPTSFLVPRVIVDHDGLTSLGLDTETQHLLDRMSEELPVRDIVENADMGPIGAMLKLHRLVQQRIIEIVRVPAQPI